MRTGTAAAEPDLPDTVDDSRPDGGNALPVVLPLIIPTGTGAIWPRAAASAT